ncbi:hypothetical protein IP92_02939 [Pseudoduganella flava]|uniref:Uncharacterized protein n=1 Tax=Pseudoduganella flava TaxID=871742 RepID=A0A562PQY7_9BURK|nr:hypothetical protein [Pseudoduganella flava]QGZ37769.1 hypothetical protein GO485_00990 [Pseudoduganella flava]TWI46580.1 hypothetical protein IP92_02939 [Pseudoduganella flava]
MNIDLYKRKARCHGRVYNLGGGGGSSQANTSTATTTTTSTNMLDQSMMGGDNAVGLNGNSNIVDKSVVNNTAFTDNSNRSTNFLDSSNRSTSTTNNTTYTSTDFGSVTKALDGMGKVSDAALTLSGQMVKDGIKGLAEQSKDNLAVLSAAFDFAKSSSAADAQKYTDVIGFAKDTITKAGDAFAEAKDGGTNKTLQIAAVASVAAIGLAIALKD